MDAFKAGGGNAALQKLLKQRAGSARFFINANHPLNVKPEKGYTPEQITSARRVIEARGRKALAQQNAKKLGEGKGSDYTYSGNQVFEKGKLIGNMVEGRFVRIPSKPTKTATPKAETSKPPKAAAPVTPVSKTEPETPAPDTRLDPAPAPAKEVVPAPSQRSLKIKEARTKYKDSPFKQWAHANQALAKALKPGQVGYEQVQEYFREQTKTKMGRGANDLSGYSSTIA